MAIADDTLGAVLHFLSHLGVEQGVHALGTRIAPTLVFQRPFQRFEGQRILGQGLERPTSRGVFGTCARLFQNWREQAMKAACAACEPRTQSGRSRCIASGSRG